MRKPEDIKKEPLHVGFWVHHKTCHERWEKLEKGVEKRMRGVFCAL
jgi:hypothetical protein